MRIDIISGLPKLLSSPLNNSIIKRAKKKKKVIIRAHDLRKYTHDRHKTIDDTPYGGGAGMILKPEPIFECIEALQKKRKYDEVIYLTADGEKFNQTIANELSLKENLILKGELEPTNEGYALAKVSITKLCEYIHKEDPSYQYKTLIPCNLFGRWDKFSAEHSHMVPAVIAKIHQAKQISQSQVEIWGDGHARR